MINPPELLVDYLTAQNLPLTIAEGLNKEEFHEARTQTYITAVKVWNALDTSNRRRIRLPANMDEDAN